MTEWLARWKGKLTRENMVVLALVGLLLMVIAIPTGRKEKNTQETKNGPALLQQEFETGEGQTGVGEMKEAAGEASGQKYARSMEERLEAFLSSMEGVGRVKVMVTMSASEEQVIEKDVPSSLDSTKETDSAGGTRESTVSGQEENTVYTTDASGSKTPYVKMTLEPVVEGVTVAAQGGGNPVIQKNITEVIQALFDIEVHKIKVVKMK